LTGLAARQVPPSFPTRRSSDLKTRRIGRFKMKLLWFVGQEIFSRSAGSRRAEKWVMDTAYGFISYRTLGSVALLTHAGSSDCRRSEEHTSELQSRENLVCRLML